jgi:hypothetical protein
MSKTSEPPPFVKDFQRDLAKPNQRSRQGGQNVKNPPYVKPPQHQADQQAQKPSQNPWIEHLNQSVCTSKELRLLCFPPRLSIVGDWFLEADLGFIFAPRGLGKTWFSMLIARGIATGRAIGPWTVHGMRRVLYIDGEMPPDAIRHRDTTLGEECDNLVFLNHQILFDKTGQILNLASVELQNAITTFLLDNRITVLFLDNLSTLVSGIDEIKGQDWEIIQPWLLQLRRHKISVVWIHHTGVDHKRMRGTTKREDPAFWVIRLEQADEEDTRTGARFISHFTKNRNAPQTPTHYEWGFSPNGDGTLVSFKEASTYHLFRKAIQDGLDTATTIAEHLDCSIGLISRFAKRAQNEGWLDIKGRRYFIDEH